MYTITIVFLHFFDSIRPPAMLAKRIAVNSRFYAGNPPDCSARENHDEPFPAFSYYSLALNYWTRWRKTFGKRSRARDCRRFNNADRRNRSPDIGNWNIRTSMTRRISICSKENERRDALSVKKLWTIQCSAGPRNWIGMATSLSVIRFD